MTYTKLFSLAFPTRPEMEQPLPTCKYNTIYVRQITNKYYHQNQVIYIFKGVFYFYHNVIFSIPQSGLLITDL